MKRYKLLSVSADTKTRKGEKSGYLTGILYLAPSNQSGRINVCPNATPGCRAACLYTAGRGSFPNVKQARINRTLKFVNDREQFVKDIFFDIRQLILEAEYQGKIPAVRLNGTSDIDWSKIKYEGKTFFEHFPNIQFYDYAKSAKRVKDNDFANYHLTFSRAETKKNQKEAEKLMKLGFNVAAVFEEKPDTWLGKEVVDGDIDDLRFLDPKGAVVALSPKGRAKRDDTGFVIRK